MSDNKSTDPQGDKKRILHLVHTPRHSGAETLVRELCLIHQAQGIQTAIASFATCDPDFMPSVTKLKEAGVQVFFPNKKLTGLDRSLFFKNVYQNFKPSLVYGHSVLPALYGRLALPFLGDKPKFVSVLHAASNYNDIQLWGTEVILSRRGDYIFSVSEAGAADYRKRIPFHRPVQVVSNGIDTKSFDRNLTLRDSCRSQLGITQTEKFIVQIGRIDAVKQQLFVFESLLPILKSDHNLQLWFAGLTESNSYKESIQKMIASNKLEKQVRILGSREDISDLLFSADLFVMPSLREAQGIALIEALASGVSVVASNIPTLQWASSYDGVTLVPPQDGDALATAAKRFLSSPQRFARDISCFDISVTADRYSSLLTET